MVVLVAKYYAKPGKGDEVAAALNTMAQQVLGDEPACALYHVCRSLENSDYFLLYEHYVNEAALAAHRETPHFKAIVEGTIVPLLDKRERDLYELVTR